MLYIERKMCLQDDEGSDSDSTETEHLLSPVKIKRPKKMAFTQRSAYSNTVL
jgi:hypothetical protein